MTIGFCTQDFILIKFYFVERDVDYISTLIAETMFGLKAYYNLAQGNALGW
jgi:hypothetical protein